MQATPKLVAALAALFAACNTLELKEARAEPDARAHLFADQLTFLQSDARVRAMLCGRRAGKSIVMVSALLEAVDGKPGTIAFYVAVTRKQAKRIIWKELKRITRESGYAFKANETELTVSLEGGGDIIIGGADKADQIDKYRGSPVVLACIDECGAFPSHLLKSLWQDVFAPACLDHKGRIVLGGTPGPTLSGIWFDTTGPERANTTIPVFEWTMHVNPHIPDVDVQLADLRKDNDWGEDHPTYIREYLGRWVQDESVLVFPFRLEVNGIAALPTQTEHGRPIDLEGWYQVIGVDIGAVASSSFVVACAHPAIKHEFIIHAEAPGGRTVSEVGAKLQAMLKIWPEAIVVMDTGGIGRGYADECRTRFSVPVIAAQKTDKAANVRLSRDRLIAGRLKILNGSSCNDLREEWAVLGWDDDHLLPSKDQEDHTSDGALYALRALRHYTEFEKCPKPKPGSREANQALEAKMWKQKADKQKRERERRRRSRGAKLKRR